jgi:hypothetical protein
VKKSELKEQLARTDELLTDTEELLDKAWKELVELRRLYSAGNQREEKLTKEAAYWKKHYISEGDEWEAMYNEVCNERNELKASLDWWVAEANRRGNVILGMVPTHPEWHRIVAHDKDAE